MKAIYFVISLSHNWGRSTELKDAIKNARITSKQTKYVIYIGVLKEETTEEEQKNILACFNVNDMGGLDMYSDPSEEDKEMVSRLLVGWITDNSFAS